MTQLLGRKEREEVMMTEMISHKMTLDTMIDSAQQEYTSLVSDRPR